MEWWDDQLTGMLVSAKLGIPTFNVYSGGFPKGFPNQDWRSKTDLLAFGKWLNTNDASKGSCIVRNTKVEPFDTPVFIQSSSGFDLLESSKNNSWRWAISDKSEYKIINYRNVSNSGQVKFEIKPAQCLTNLKLNIKLGNWENQFELDKNETKIVTILIGFLIYISTRILVITARTKTGHFPIHKFYETNFFTYFIYRHMKI
jgi:hypothetical protein